MRTRGIGVQDVDSSMIRTSITKALWVRVAAYYECEVVFFFFQAEDGIRDVAVTGVQTCALPISKDETRADAARAGLAVADRAESQEACFLAGDDYRSFLERNGVASRVGPIVDLEGRELGRHDGYWRYTPGQRKGLGVAAGSPLYVLGSDSR